jgi:hypothetical protein
MSIELDYCRKKFISLFAKIAFVCKKMFANNAFKPIKIIILVLGKQFSEQIKTLFIENITDRVSPVRRFSEVCGVG